MRLRKILSVSVVLIIVLCAVFSVSAEPETTGAGTVAFSADENMVRADTGSSRYELWLNVMTADICLADTASGEQWWSSPQNYNEDGQLSGVAAEEVRSQLLIKYYDADKVSRDINSAKCIEQNSVEISYAENGFKTVYNFNDENENFSVTVLYQLADDRLKITLPADGIKEKGTSRISTVTLLPNLFSGSAGEEGYLLIPESNGAVMRFSDSKPYAESYSGKVYGRDAAVSQLYKRGEEGQVLLPVFGMIRNGSGLFCVIDGNAAAAEITAVPSGKFSDRANAAAVFTVNQLDTAIIPDRDWKYKEYPVAAEKSSEYDCSVSVYPLSDAENYSDLAAFYRELLDEKYGRTLMKEHFAGALELYGQGWKNTSFMGFPVKKNIEATSFEEAEEIINILSEGLGGNIAVTLNGFGAEGYEQKTSNKVKPDGSLGGKNGLKRLAETAPENTRIYWSQNVMLQYNTGIFKKKYAVTGLNKVTVKGAHYSLSTYGKEEDRYWWYLNPERIAYNLERLNSSFKYGTGLALQFIGDTLYSDYSDKNYTERQKSLEIIQKAIGKLKSPPALSGGNLYAALNAGVITDVYGAKAAYDCMSEYVPFYSMVFYGYTGMSSMPLNDSSEWETELLNCLEYGIAPAFQLTSGDNRMLRETSLDGLVNTCFKNIKASVSDIFKTYNEAAKELAGRSMIYHERNGGVVTVRYSGGKTLVINRSENGISMDSGILKPGEWKIY